MEIKQITPQEAYDLANKGTIFIDVREPNETAELRYGILNITYLPMSEFENKFMAILPQDKNIPLILACRSGGRSMMLANLLARNGYNNLSNLAGGIIAWSAVPLPCIEGDEGCGCGKNNCC